MGAGGRRTILGVELANRESTSSWREFIEGLRRRGLKGVELVVSDDHAGLKKAIAEIIRQALEPEKVRKKTRPSRKAVQKRLDEKRGQARRKSDLRPPSEPD